MNILALLACAVIAVVLGMLWYGPFFGKPWRRELGITDEDIAHAKTDPKGQKQMMRSAVLAALGALVTAGVLDRSIFMSGGAEHLPSLLTSIHVTFWSWAGFAVPVLLASVLWENRSWKWWLIASGYYLVLWVLMAVVLTLWG